MSVARPVPLLVLDRVRKEYARGWLRRQFGIEEGTRASVTATDEGILLKPITRAYIKSLRGKYRHLPVMEALAEDRKREREL